MFRTIAVLILCLALAAPASALSIVPLTREVELRPRDREAVQRSAWATLGVDAAEIRGSRWIRWGYFRPLQAWVRCKPHRSTDTWQLARAFQCEKRGSWKCESTWQLISTRFLGNDPFEFSLDQFTAEEALEGLACLEGDLARQPGSISSDKLNHWGSISPAGEINDVIRTNLGSESDCYELVTVRRCPAGVERAPPAIDRECPVE